MTIATSRLGDRLGQPLGASLAIFCVAFAVRATQLWQLSSSVLFDLRMGDARVYHLWAQDIASGNWIGTEVFYQAPLYPYFLATLYATVGDDLVVVRACQAVLGSVSCVFLALAGWRFFGRRVGIVAGLLLAIYAPAFFSEITLQKSVLDLFFLTLGLWILGEFNESRDAKLWVALGLSLGLLILSRENTLAFPVVLVFWLFVAVDVSRQRRIACAALLIAGMGLVLLPVVARNLHVSGDFHLTTSQLGHNLYIGNNEAADGTYAPLIAGRGDPLIERKDAIDLAEHAMGRELSAAEVSSFYTDRALRFIREHPSDWLWLMGRKVALVFNAVEIVDTEDQYTHAESSSLLRVAGAVFHFGVLAPLACFGVFTSWGMRRRLLPLYLLFLTYVATLLPFYVFARYRLPLVPFLSLFAAAGVVGAREFLRERSPLKLLPVAGSVAAVTLFCNWTLTDPRTMRSVTHYNIGNELVAREKLELGIAQYRTAIELDDENARATHNLAVMLAAQGEYEPAFAAFMRAIEIDPSYAEAHFNFGLALRESGDLAAAADHYRQGLVLEPRRAEMYNALGLIYTELGHRHRAIASFEAALEIDPTFQDARVNLRRVQLE